MSGATNWASRMVTVNPNEKIGSIKRWASQMQIKPLPQNSFTCHRLANVIARKGLVFKDQGSDAFSGQEHRASRSSRPTANNDHIMFPGFHLWHGDSFFVYALNFF